MSDIDRELIIALSQVNRMLGLKLKEANREIEKLKPRQEEARRVSRVQPAAFPYPLPNPGPVKIYTFGSAPRARSAWLIYSNAARRDFECIYPGESPTRAYKAWTEMPAVHREVYERAHEKEKAAADVVLAAIKAAKTDEEPERGKDKKVRTLKRPCPVELPNEAKKPRFSDDSNESGDDS